MMVVKLGCSLEVLLRREVWGPGPLPEQALFTSPLSLLTPPCCSLSPLQPVTERGRHRNPVGPDSFSPGQWGWEGKVRPQPPRTWQIFQSHLPLSLSLPSPLPASISPLCLVRWHSEKLWGRPKSQKVTSGVPPNWFSPNLESEFGRSALKRRLWGPRKCALGGPRSHV